MQPNGKIVAAGSNSTGSGSDFVTIRLNQNGTYDGTFANLGKSIVSISNGNDGANSTLLDTEGRIVVGGFSSNSGNSDFALLRLNTDGSQDTAFGNGSITEDVSIAGEAYANALAIQADGKMILAGEARYSQTLERDYAVVRLNANGAIDETFGNNGRQLIDQDRFDYATAAAIQPDGKIIIGGVSNLDNDYKFTIIRFNNSGSLDQNFGTAGIVNVDLSGRDDI